MFSFLKNIFKSGARINSIAKLEGVDFADAVFQNLILDQNAPGISVTLIHNGVTLLKKGYGYSDLDNKIPVSVENTLFRIASISKCITGLALGKMVEEGIVDWDDSFFSHVLIKIIESYFYGDDLAVLLNNKYSNYSPSCAIFGKNLFISSNSPLTCLSETTELRNCFLKVPWKLLFTVTIMLEA